MLKLFWNRLEEGMIAFLLVFMTLLVFLDVVMRFGFGTGFLWTQELTLYTSAWFVLFGISYGLKVGAHIGVDAVIELVPPGARRVLTMIAIILCLGYCAIFIYGSWVYLSKIYTIGVSMDDLRFPAWFINMLPEKLIVAWQIDLEDPMILLWMPQSILLVGLFLFAGRLFELLYRVIIGESVGFFHVDEAEESLELAKKLSQEKSTQEEEQPK